MTTMSTLILRFAFGATLRFCEQAEYLQRTDLVEAGGGEEGVVGDVTDDSAGDISG